MDPANGRSFGSVADQVRTGTKQSVFQTRFHFCNIKQFHHLSRRHRELSWLAGSGERFRMMRKLAGSCALGRSARDAELASLGSLDFWRKQSARSSGRSPFLFASPVDSYSSPQISSSTVNVVSFFRSILPPSTLITIFWITIGLQRSRTGFSTKRN